MGDQGYCGGVVLPEDFIFRTGGGRSEGKGLEPHGWKPKVGFPAGSRRAGLRQHCSDELLNAWFLLLPLTWAKEEAFGPQGPSSCTRTNLATADTGSVPLGFSLALRSFGLRSPSPLDVPLVNPKVTCGSSPPRGSSPSLGSSPSRGIATCLPPVSECLCVPVSPVSPLLLLVSDQFTLDLCACGCR